MAESDWLAFYDELIADPGYLGTPKVLESVTWAKVGRDEVVVSAEKAAERQSAMNKAGSSSKKGDLSDLDPVELLLVAKISAYDCWLSPEFWTRPTEFTPTLADLKLTCRLVAPDDPTFAKNFAVGIKNLDTLIARVKTEGYRQAGVFVNHNENPKTSIKLRHEVFEPTPKEANGKADAKGTFPMQNWPVKKGTAAEQALERMASTHRAHPIAAYDKDGNLIPPSQYMSVLPGATVRANITIRHWKISSSDNRDIYTADISSLRVIVPPPQVPSTPSKKRGPIPTRDPGPSPYKRTRVV